MNYVSLFSGIEAASVAWRPLGWRPMAFSEVDPYCCQLLEKRYPEVPNLGDIREIDWNEWKASVGSVDLVVGGSPCQSFSVAGRRKGVMDERGRLMLEYIRAVRTVRPRWLIWENVPGVLSQSGGDAFATLLNELSRCGYSLAWRVLDAQFFSLAQRRRRVYVVGCAAVGRAAAVLFERSSLRWDSPTSREKRARLTARAREGAEGVLPFDTSQLTHPENRSNPRDGDPSMTLGASAHAPAVALSQYGDIAGTLTARHDSSACADRGQTIIAFSAGQSSKSGSAAAAVEIAPTLRASSSGTNQVPTICMTDTQSNTAIDEDLCGTLSVHSHKDPPTVCLNSDSDECCATEIAHTFRANGHTATVTEGTVIRRLTPVECERLQGFPDGYTDIGGTPDAPRYRALGNSMPVPVMAWLGRRIQEVDIPRHPRIEAEGRDSVTNAQKQKSRRND